MPVNRSGSPDPFLTTWHVKYPALPAAWGHLSLQDTPKLDHVLPQPALDCCDAAACAEAIIPEQTQNDATMFYLECLQQICITYSPSILLPSLRHP